MEFFRGWIKLGYAYTDYLKYFKNLDNDDKEIARELIEWCKEKKRKSGRFWEKKKRWEKKSTKELFQGIQDLPTNREINKEIEKEFQKIEKEMVQDYFCNIFER